MKLSGNFNNYIVILLIFLSSFLIRLPNLNRPLANQWELCTAISLVQLDVWQKAEISTYNYLLPINYPGTTNIVASKWSMYNTTKDAKGNVYYLSFPDFYLLVPYYLFKVLHIPASVISVQILNVLLHLVALILILKISNFISPVRYKGYNIIAIVACLIYTFSPSPLWFHTNIYIMHPFIIPLLLLCILLLLRFIYTDNIKTIRYLAIAILLFVLCYTEWIGFLVCVTYFLVAAYLYVKTKAKKYLFLGIICFISSVSSLALFVWLCGITTGWPSTIEYFTRRMGERSGPLTLQQMILWTERLILWCFRGYAAAFALLTALLFYLLAIKKVSLRSIGNQKTKWLFILLLTPSFLHHIILRQFTIEHEFSTLVDGLTLSFFIGLLANYAITNHWLSKRKILMGGSLFLLLNAVSFFLQHYPGSKSFNDFPYDVAEKIGTAVNKNTKADEVPFLVNYKGEYDWQIQWYAKRSIALCPTRADFEQKAQQLKMQKVKVFVLDSSYMFNAKIDSVKMMVIQ